MEESQIQRYFRLIIDDNSEITIYRFPRRAKLTVIQQLRLPVWLDLAISQDAYPLEFYCSALKKAKLCISYEISSITIGQHKVIFDVLGIKTILDLDLNIDIFIFTSLDSFKELFDI